MTNWEKFVIYNHEVCGMQYEKFGISPDVEFLEDEFVLCAECGDLVTKEHFEQSGYETACPICCWDWEQQNYGYDEDEEEDEEEQDED